MQTNTNRTKTEKSKKPNAENAKAYHSPKAPHNQPFHKPATRKACEVYKSVFA